MRLLTHNFLSSQFLKNVKEGYPLILRATKRKEYEFNEEMVTKLLPKLNYLVLLEAAKSIGVDVTSLPAELPDTLNTDLLKQVGELAMSVEVVDGELECPESGRRFLIREGIPNMLVNEEEQM